MKVEIYSDIVCPWCYIGERRFARALAAFPKAAEVEVVYRSYQLDPHAPVAAEPLSRYLERRFGRSAAGMQQHVGAAAAGEGVTVDWERAQAVNTLTAHRLLLLAEREYGAAVQRALVERLFAAHFTEGGDVSDHALLTELAASVGMDAARVRAYLDSGEGLAEVREALGAARDLGVRAVPTFVFEGELAVEGAQSASTFLQVLEEVAARGTAVEAGGAGEGCDDGSCAL